MSSRCKCCNSILTEDELKTRDYLSGNFSELCSFCLDLCEDKDDQANTMPHMCEEWERSDW